MSYIKQNAGCLTNSKLKAWRKCPRLYKLQYIDEIEQEGDSKVLVLGTAFHYLMEVWLNKFFDVYEILLPRERKSPISEKIQLNDSDWSKVLLAYEEACRQPLMNTKSRCPKEKEIIVDYKWIKLKSKMDRIDITHWIIRDFKYIADINKFDNYLHEYVFDYYWQAAFYTLVASLKYWKPFRFIFDVLDKTNWASAVFEVDPTIHIQRIQDSIDEFIEDKEYNWVEDRSKCLWCSHYKHCNSTAIQKEIIKI